MGIYARPGSDCEGVMTNDEWRASRTGNFWVNYWLGYHVCAVLIFFGCWIYAISEYGFLLGVGLGWFPSLIVASVVSLAWPLLLAAVVLVVATFFHR